MDNHDKGQGPEPVNSSRRLFLRKSTALTLAAGSAAALGSTASVALGKNDNDKLEALLVPQTAQRSDFQSIQAHENAHVQFLVNALGDAARPKPTFQNLEQKYFFQFVLVSQALENTGVGAYLGAAPSIDSADYLAAAGSIFAIEARHAGYLNSILRDPITGNAFQDNANPDFELPLTAAEVVTNAGPFIASLNGGPRLTYSTTPSPENDIAILNFALALEYLEAEFYNINVPKFYKAKK